MATATKTAVLLLLLTAFCSVVLAHRNAGFKPYRVVLPFPRKHQRTPHRAIGCLHYGHSCLGAHGKRSAASEEEWTANLLAYLGLTEQPQEGQMEPMANAHASQPRPLRPMTNLPAPRVWLKPNADVSSEAPNTRTSIYGLSMRPILLRNLARTELSVSNDDFPKNKPILDADFENYDEEKYSSPEALRRFGRSVEFTGEQMKGAVKKMRSPAEERNNHYKNKLNSISLQNFDNAFDQIAGANSKMSFLKASTDVKTLRRPKEHSRHAESMDDQPSSGNHAEAPNGASVTQTELNNINLRYRRRAMVLQSNIGSRFYNKEKIEGTEKD